MSVRMFVRVDLTASIVYKSVNAVTSSMAVMSSLAVVIVPLEKMEEIVRSLVAEVILVQTVHSFVIAITEQRVIPSAENANVLLNGTVHVVAFDKSIKLISTDGKREREGTREINLHLKKHSNV